MINTSPTLGRLEELARALRCAEAGCVRYSIRHSPYCRAHDADEVVILRTMTGHRPALPLRPTERREVIRRLAARGSTDLDIAHRLGVSDRTVLRLRHTHRITPARYS